MRTPAPATAANEAFPLHGIGLVQDERAPSRAAIKAALDDMPGIVNALAPSVAPRLEESYDNTPDFAPVPGPSPRM